MGKKFWEEKPLDELSEQEWESLCMNCGKCCLIKYQHKNRIYFTNMICRHFDVKHCRCSVYAKRLSTGSCAKVDMSLLQNQIELLPLSCAYRRLFEGKPLPDYHYLLTGDKTLIHRRKETVREKSVCSETACEQQIKKKLKSTLSLPPDIVDRMMENGFFLDSAVCDICSLNVGILETQEVPADK